MKIRLVGTPNDAPYLTPGKVYEVKALVEPIAMIEDDTGEYIDVRLPNSMHPCVHARPAKWELVE